MLSSGGRGALATMIGLPLMHACSATSGFRTPRGGASPPGFASRPHWLVLALTLAAAAPAEAQLLRGRIVDNNTGAAVAGATIVLRDGADRDVGRTTADTLGQFQLRPSFAGSFTLSVAHAAYVPYTSAPLALHRNEITDVTVTLSGSAIPLEPLVVHARRAAVPGKLADFERRRAEGFGHFITRQDIERRPMATATTLLRTVPGVVLQRVSPRGGSDRSESYIIMFQGTRAAPCGANVYVDGALVTQGGETVDAWLQPDLLAAVEVYPRAASAPVEYSRGGCGVVLFWTREDERLRATSRGLLRYLVAGAAALGIVGYLVFN